jgi:hypothetical protein
MLINAYPPNSQAQTLTLQQACEQVIAAEAILGRQGITDLLDWLDTFRIQLTDEIGPSDFPTVSKADPFQPVMKGEAR